MSRRRASAITLRALDGDPLETPGIRDMIVATAHAIAERQGMALLDVRTTPSSITVKLASGRFEAIGFAVELRRLTTTWYTRKFGAPTLWGEPAPEDGPGGAPDDGPGPDAGSPPP